MKRFTSLFISFLLFVTLGYAQNLRHIPSVNGTIKTIVTRGDTVYIGGLFTRVFSDDSTSFYGGIFDRITGKLLNPSFRPNGRIWCAIPDGNGGYFVSGEFTQIGDSVRGGIAHLNSLGMVTGKLRKTSITGTARSLCFNNDTLFIGGVFTAVSGQAKINLAMVSVGSDLVLPPNLNTSNLSSSIVSVLKLVDRQLYIGGSFSTLAGQPRKNIACIDLTTLSLTAWNPGTQTDAKVYAIECKDSLIFVGGDFIEMSGKYKKNLVALNKQTGIANSFNADIQGSYAPVFTIKVYGNTLFIGGNFSNLGSQYTGCTANVNIQTGSLVSPKIFAGNSVLVNCLEVDGNVLYVGGFARNSEYSFTRVDAFNIPDASHLDLWNIGGVSYTLNSNALAISGNSIFAGGNAQLYGGKRRNNVAAFLASTGKVLDWNPSVRGEVFAIQPMGNKIIIGGSFDSINGIPRKNIGAVSLISGQVDSLNVIINNPVNTLAVQDTILLAGGTFNNVSGKAVGGVVALHAYKYTVLPTLYVPANIGAVVNAFLIKGNTLYLGGNFTTSGTQMRQNILSCDLLTGTLKPWNATTNGEVYSILLEGNKVFLGGAFVKVNNTNCNYFAVLDTASGVLIPAALTAVSIPKHMYLYNGTIYTNSSFSAPNAPSRYPAAINPKTLTLVPSGFLSGKLPSTYALGFTPKIFLAGGFNSLVDPLYLNGIQYSLTGMVRDSAIVSLDNVLIKKYCKGNNIVCSFRDNIVADSSNIYSVQLSDSTGNFSLPTVLGTSTETVNVLSLRIPTNTPSGKKYRIRIVSSSPARISFDNGSDIEVSSDMHVSKITVSNPRQCFDGNIFHFTDSSEVSSGTLTRQWKFGDNTVSSNKTYTKTYTIRGDYPVKLISTSSNGCVDTATQIIRVIQPDATIFGQGNGAVCSGDSLGLYTEPGYNYTWFRNMVPIPGSNSFHYYAKQAGSYSVIASVPEGCGDTSSQVDIRVNPSPAKTHISLHSGDTLFSDSASFSYNWYLNDTVILNHHLRYFMPKNGGNYTIRLVTDSGCLGILSDPFAFARTGLVSLQNTNRIRLYPNPANSHLIIETIENDMLHEVLIKSIDGKVICQKTGNRSTLTEIVLPLELTTGIYLTEIRMNDGKRYYQKILINK